MRRLIDTRRGVRALALWILSVVVVVPLASAAAASSPERRPVVLSMVVRDMTPKAALDKVVGMTSPGDSLFLFSRPTAKAGDRITVRSIERPRRSQPQQGQAPFQGVIRLYLVPTAAARKVRSQFDARAFFIGAVTLDSRGRGSLPFSVPPLDSGSYAIAGWCSRCRQTSRPTFFVQAVGAQTPPRYRRQALLRILASDSAGTCAVTLPNGSTPPGLKALPNYHGNGMLWALLPADGVYRGHPDSDGTFFEKIPWFAAGTSGELRVSAQRVDARAPTPRTQPVPGSPPGFRGAGSWATRVWFTSEGCWKVSGRIRDISLIFIAKILRAEGG